MNVKQHHVGWGLIALFGILAAWLLSKGKNLFVHESVTVTLPDPVTGAPTYDSSLVQSIPQGQPVEPLGTPQEGATNHPANPAGATCPLGYTLWYDSNTGNYWCFPPQEQANPRQPIVGGG